ncbi:hypothetical protein FB451DRAFT_1182665 [Mycena latifolia]|nr:hypothetical protein FB451DRAFT_1182665 [Mycena latifolia]
MATGDNGDSLHQLLMKCHDISTEVQFIVDSPKCRDSRSGEGYTPWGPAIQCYFKLCPELDPDDSDGFDIGQHMWAQPVGIWAYNTGTKVITVRRVEITRGELIFFEIWPGHFLQRWLKGVKTVDHGPEN